MINSTKADQLVHKGCGKMRLALSSTLCILLICPVVFLVSEYIEWRRTIQLVNKADVRYGGYGTAYTDYYFDGGLLQTIPWLREITIRLTYVGLNDRTLSTDELGTISTQSPLRKLAVSNSTLDLSAIDQLGSLRNLWWIDASGSNLNDSAFEFLTTLPSLTEIDVSNTEVSAEAVQRAKRRNPRLMVHH